MGMRWDTFGYWFKFCVCAISVWGIRECWSLNDEGLVLLEFRTRITFDPHVALANWNPNDCDPCKWFGVRCVDGKVQMLDLNGLSLQGTLAPELGKLSHLKSLVLRKNKFSGAIPKELGDLANLELLDLRENNLSGSIPTEINRMSLLKHLKIEGDDDSQGQGKIRFPSKLLLVDYCSSPLTTLFACMNRKFGHWFKFLGYQEECHDLLPSSNEPDISQNMLNLVNSARRKLLDQSSNLAAAPYSGGPTIEFSSVPTTLSSGAFPAVPNANEKQNQSPAPAAPLPSPPHDASSEGNQTSHQQSTDGASENSQNYIIIAIVVAVLVAVFIILLCIWRKRAAKIITPWKSGISGQLQKAFITGVPKLNRGELETACEDFSNIIVGFEFCTIYKGTLSSGVEIAVVSTLNTSSKDWSKSMEINYRKKIATLSRINHKNFINLIGFCEEEEPFTRMLVFEYAPNGSVFEHLHVKDVENLDWSQRVRIIMGTGYCLQYMHHDLNPPIAHTKLTSNMVLLTDDFAAKLAEVTFADIESTAKTTGGDSKKSAPLPPRVDLETNIYNFGILLLEIISGKLPYSEEEGNLVNWAADYLNDKQRISSMIDPNLKSFKDNELRVICEVIQDCIQPDPRLRPTMREIISKLREVIGVSPEQAVPRLSPLWWAELEILSVEAT